MHLSFLQDLEKSLAAQKNLLQQQQELEAESTEMQDFLQEEKSALAEALKDAEMEVSLHILNHSCELNLKLATEQVCYGGFVFAIVSKLNNDFIIRVNLLKKKYIYIYQTKIYPKNNVSNI